MNFWLKNSPEFMSRHFAGVVDTVTTFLDGLSTTFLDVLYTTFLDARWAVYHVPRCTIYHVSRWTVCLTVEVSGNLLC